MSESLQRGGAALAWLVPFAAHLAAQADPAVATIQLPKPQVVAAATSADVDRDGLADLVVVAVDRGQRQRTVQVHLQQRGAVPFRAETHWPPYPLEADVVAFTFADVHAAPGRELVLLTPERAVAVVRGDGGSVDYVPLFACRLLWRAADRLLALPLIDACVDADGDGKDDLLLPQPDGALLVLDAAAGAAAVRRELVLPPWRNPASDAANGGSQYLINRLKLEFQPGDDEGDSDRRRSGGALLELESRAPVVRLLDTDGDGTLELVAERNRTLWTLPVAGGAVVARPLPMPADRLKLFDPSFDAQLADVDGDGKLDLVLASSASRDDEIEVRTDFHRGFAARSADAASNQKPDTRLRTQAHARSPQLVDVDGDGKLVLVVVTLRVDALRALTGGDDVTLQAQCNVFRGTGERFVQPAMLARVLQVPVRRDGGGAFVHMLPGRDGARAGLLHRDGDTLVLLPCTGAAGSAAFGDPQPVLKLPPKSQLELLDAATGLLAVVGDGELLVARIRR